MVNDETQVKVKAKGISVRLLALLAAFAVVVITFILIVNKIVLEDEKGFDREAFNLLSRVKSNTTTDVLKFFTFFGSVKFLLPAYIILSLYYLIFKRNTNRSLNIAAIGLGSGGLLFWMKNFFQRHRPVDPLIDVTGFSFPSGHSFSIFTLCGLLIYIIFKGEVSRSSKILSSLALVLVAILVAGSRVYLHVHYASDVVAGLCLSIMWLTLSIYLLENLIGKRFKKNPVL